MIFLKVNDTLYSATISGRIKDTDWNNRESKTITFTSLSYDDVIALLPDNTPWSIVQTTQVAATDETGAIILDESGNPTLTEVEEEFDNSEYSISGEVTNHRDGRVSIKMGKKTDSEILQNQLTSAVGEEELTTAYLKGVNSL